MHQRRERRTNEGKSLNMKVNESAHDKGYTHAISER